MTARITVWLLILHLSLFANSHDWEAHQYAEANQFQHGWADAFFFERYAFRGNETILDIGCGDGSLTARLSAHTSGWVIGIDKSHSMIAHAQRKYENDQLSFLQASAEDPHLYRTLENQCDLIVSFHCLHWVEDQLSVLKGIETALKNQGMAFLRFCSDGFDPIQQIADELILSNKWSPHFTDFTDPIHRFNTHEYGELILQFDFEIVELKEYIGSDIVENIAQVRNHVQGWLPHYKHLPKQLADEFIDDLLMQFIDQYPQTEENQIRLPDCYLEVVLKKITL